MEITYDKIIRETPKAYLVLFGDEWIWLPKSKIEIRELTHEKYITLPMWLAVEKGLEDYEC